VIEDNIMRWNLPPVGGRLLLLSVLSAVALAKQEEAPEPYAAPLRELEFGELNFLHTTDTHGWHAGHLHEPSFSADWGDYIDFAARLRDRLESEGKDLLLVDTGDRVEGNGLYDASDPKGKYTFDIFKQQSIDLICSGNHELYKQNSSQNEFNITVPAYKDNYLASNLDIHDPRTGEVVPLARRHKRFITRQQGIRVTAFGFLYDFVGNANNTIVYPVEDILKETWFQEVLADTDVDLFVVIGHSAVRSAEFQAVFEAIRRIHRTKPIQFFGGHYHIRDYKIFDSRSVGLASGRFMETIGFQSISGLLPPTGASGTSHNLTFSRRYIDNNLYSFYHHTNLDAPLFHSKKGAEVSRMISDARSALGLNTTFGCAPKDFWMSRAPYPSDQSIYTWLDQQVLPEMVNDPKRSHIPRLVLTNTGAIRFDMFQGLFTRDSTYIICPFTSGFHYIKDVPYDTASKLTKILNNAGDFVESGGVMTDLHLLGPPEQLAGSRGDPSKSRGITKSLDEQIILKDTRSLKPGYTTVDDAGTDGDDTVHSPIPFYNVPNCIESLVNTTTLEANDATVDLVFNEFIQPWVLLALRFLGLKYDRQDVSPYLHGETFTDLISKWISENWAQNCEKS
jgi:2',3'-cyclic-nucleotide 2'-phosphodiesterase (5'-nucleotidase family)